MLIQTQGFHGIAWTDHAKKIVYPQSDTIRLTDGFNGLRVSSEVRPTTDFIKYVDGMAAGTKQVVATTAVADPEDVGDNTERVGDLGGNTGELEHSECLEPSDFFDFVGFDDYCDRLKNEIPKSKLYFGPDFVLKRFEGLQAEDYAILELHENLNDGIDFEQGMLMYKDRVSDIGGNGFDSVAYELITDLVNVNPCYEEIMVEQDS
jgi:hypothetical protein